MKPLSLSLLALVGITLLICGNVSAQAVPGGVCKDVSERTGDVGCWILAHDKLGKLPSPPVFWHLDVYPTLAAAQASKTSHSTVLEAFGQVWLLTIDRQDWRPNKGQHIADIGPLPVDSSRDYSAQYMEAVFTPGMTAPAHTHSGPEAWYMLSGESCLETPEGKQIGRAGGKPVIVPGGLPMHLTATGTETRRALALILHDSSQPATTHVHDWAPKGLCNSK